jgi:hypothetical protein
VQQEDSTAVAPKFWKQMLQYAVSRLLGSYLAEYVQHVDGKSLDLALWDGDV